MREPQFEYGQIVLRGKAKTLVHWLADTEGGEHSYVVREGDFEWGTWHPPGAISLVFVVPRSSLRPLEALK